MKRKMKKSIFTNPVFVVIAALFCTALWGSATPFIKTGYLCLKVEGIPSIMLFAGIRFFLAGILTIVICSLIERKFLFPEKENLKYVGIISIFQTILQYIFFYVGLANTSGVKGTILSGSSAFFSILVACLVFKQEKLTVKKVIACIIGFAGVVVVNLNGLQLNFNFFGDAFVIFSGVSLAFSSVLMKLYSKHENPVVLSGYQFVSGGLVMTVIGFVCGGTMSFESVKGMGILVYLAFLSAMAYALWGILLKYNPVSKVTIFSFMTPVFGVILSKLILIEESAVSFANVLIALILICIGIITINYQKKED
ncbi:MAG: DMT family transporter [Ruminococcaceae bacterium]|nr:DMT family transporter [Oscillospiraceae bacterium]